MSNKLKEILEESVDKKAAKKAKMLNKLHELDDKIDDFLAELEDEILSSDKDSPVFVKKAQQLLANCSKEYAEFISAVRAIVNSVDRKGKIVASFNKQESMVRDVRNGLGDQEEPVEETPIKKALEK